MSTTVVNDTTLTGRHWLAGSLVLVIAPAVIGLPPWLALLAVGLIAWHLAREYRGWRLPGAWVRTSVLAIGVAGIWNLHHTIFGRDAGVALLSLLVAMKLMELRTRRDGNVIVVLGYFLVAGSLLFDQSLLSGTYLLATVVALTATLAALHHPGGGRADTWRYLRLGAALLLQGLPIAALLFVLFPRLPGTLHWTFNFNQASGRTGLSEELTMGRFSDLVDNEEVAFRARFSGPVPPARELYWRGPVLWHTDGRRWTRLTPAEKQLLANADPQPSGPALEYSVLMEPNRKRWLLALDLPAHISERDARIAPDFEVTADRPIAARRQYYARSYPSVAPPSGDLEALTQALALPEHANPRTRALAKRWLAEGLHGEALVQRVLALIREEPFVYTRKPPTLGRDPVDQFLFDTRRGFCEHYAAAFVTLMRAGEVPARLVTGYQGGQRREFGSFVVVRQSDAHAWAEVWLEGRGWVRVDPTAAVPPARVERSTDASRFEETPALFARGPDVSWPLQQWNRAQDAWESVNDLWTEWVLGYDADTQMDLLYRLGLLQQGWGRVVAALATGVGLVMATVFAWLWWGRPRHRDPLARLWERFCAKLARRGLVRAPDEGPIAYAARVAAARPDLAAAVTAIASRYAGLRYGADAGGERELRGMVRRFRA